MSEGNNNNNNTNNSNNNTTTTITTDRTWRTCFRNNLFHGKVGIVTGGGTGIGRAIATELAILGATIIIASRDVSKCQDAANVMNKEIQQHHQSTNSEIITTATVGRIVAGPSSFNIRDENNIKELVRYVIETYGSIDILVNNAGGQFISPAEEISRKGMVAVVETNLIGTFMMCKEVYNQYMKDNGGGSIVNITIGNRNGMPYMMHSGAARAGVENMTATLCTEWIESNVRINCVRPGIIFTDSGFENYGPAGDMFVDRILPTIPAKRFGSPQEVSSAVVWLLSEGASYVTGTVLAVDGAGSYTFLPLVEISDEEHLTPFYGTLPKKARL